MIETSRSDKMVYYKATVEKFANTLHEQTTFPKKPLRKTHLRSVYFAELFGLTSTLSSPKADGVLDLHMSKRPLIDPVVSVFGK